MPSAHRLITPDEFAIEAKERKVEDAAVYRLAPAELDFTDVEDRVVRYVFSTGAVARDNHTINQNGWDMTGFDLNPVFLWGHDSGAPPIGKVIEKSIRNGVFGGAVKYIERDISEFADMVFQMVKARYLNAVSTSWLPIEWKWSTDKNRLGGIDFIKQDLLEISQVSVPAQINAIATARAAGIDTGPMFQWATKLLDSGGSIVVPRTELEELRRQAKMPTAKNKRASDEAAAERLAKEKKNQTIRSRFGQGLFEVSQLAWLLEQLAWLEDCVEFEADIEQDGSDIPERLTKLLNDAGLILVDMTKEEVAELLAAEESEDETGDDMAVLEQAAKTRGQKMLLGVLTASRCIPAPYREFRVGSVRSVPFRAKPEDIARIAISNSLALEQMRAGKVLSQSNMDALNRAMDHCRQMADCIQGVIDAATPPEEVDDAEAQAAASARERKAKALKLKLKHAA